MKLHHIAAVIALVVPFAAQAGLFSVSPVRIDLTPGAKSGSISVSNEGSSLPLRVKLMKWTQDEKGEAVYTPASDLVYFPRELVVEPGTTRSIRVLALTPPKGTEQAYRLFIEEQLPPAPAEEVAGRVAKVAVLVNFGVAVYVRGEDTPPALTAIMGKDAGGNPSFTLSNTGSSHTFVNSLSAQGVSFPGFKPHYLLGGASSPVVVSASAYQCASLPKNLVADTAEGNLPVRINATALGCP